MSRAFTFHGGRLTDARARFGGTAEDWVDLSTGINPDPWPGGNGQAIDWRGLPDPQGLRELESEAAAYFDADSALCCAVPGSEIGLRMLARILGLPGRHLPLSYSTHADAFADYPAAIPGGRSTFVIANPNNPDGELSPPDRLLNLLERQEAGSGWLIVDEAFADCRADWTIAGAVREDRRLIVLRSFGKFFGLAGVRLGFVLAPLAVTGRLRRLMGEWPVCSAALAYGTAAYSDSAWIAATRAALPSHAARLDAVLARHGLAAQGECPLFRLVKTDRAHSLFTALARRHILIRPFAAHPGLLRFGLPTGPADLALLDAALDEACARG